MYRTPALLNTCRTWQQRAAETIGSRLNHKTQAQAHTSTHASPNTKATEPPGVADGVAHGGLGLSIKVETREKSEALRYAHKVYGEKVSGKELVLWTDASSVHGRTGAHTCAAVLRGQTPPSWGVMTRVLPFAGNNLAELFAILLALKLAVQHMKDMTEVAASAASATATPTPTTGGRRTKAKKTRIKIFSDSKLSLILISRELAQQVSKRRKAQEQAVRDIVLGHIGFVGQQLERLGIGLELHWVPRGSVTGNLLAHRAARDARLGFLKPEAWNREAGWATIIKNMERQLETRQ